MTLSTSLFNLGIYKNTLRRFKWGSFLYFVILFFSLPFIFLTQSPADLYNTYSRSITNCPLILRDSFIIIPLLAATVVPTITAALAFNNIHSQKQSIFVHSLPLTRKENYISTIAACLTLMAAPVIAVALVLLIMSFTTYGQAITSMSVIYWTFIMLSVLFIMFSVSTFSAILTGNTATHFVINIFIHLIPVLIAVAIFLISDIFLFGFWESEGFIATEIMNNNPIVWLYGRIMSYRRNPGNIFMQPQMWIYLVGAAIFYALGYALYRKRKIEACGDVAAFRIFRPILKYAVTSSVAIAAFGILSSSDIGAFAIFTVATVFTLITYFAAEMLLNKSFKVFGKYKGYIAFWIVCGAFISFFAFTNVFGYETRIPDKADIESATIFHGYYNEYPYSLEDGSIDTVTKLHSEFIKDIPIVGDSEYRSLRVAYKLKNGKILERYYPVNDELFDKALSQMYSYKDYKLQITELSKLNIDNIKNSELSVSTNNFSHYIAVNEASSELLYAIKKDVEELSYEELEKSEAVVRIRVNVQMQYEDNEKEQVFVRAAYGTEPDTYDLQSFSITVNPSFKNTIAFLKEKGYYDEFMSQISKNLYICSVPVHYFTSANSISYKDDTGTMEEFKVSTDDFVKIPEADAYSIVVDLMNKNRHKGLSDGKNYMLFCQHQDIKNQSTTYLGNMCTSYSAQDLPKVLTQYVNQ